MIETQSRARAETAAGGIRPAEVLAADADGLYTLRLLDGADNETRWATHALAGQAPCRVGCRVLVALAGRDGGYVIGVLDASAPSAGIGSRSATAGAEGAPGDERLVLRDPARDLVVAYDPSTGALTLTPGAAANLVIGAPNGDVTLHAGKRLRLAGETATDIATRRLTVSARRTLVALGDAVVHAATVTATVRRLRQVAERVEVTATRIIERAGSVYRRAASLYRQDAKRVRLTADEGCDLRGNRIDLRAQGDVRVDGEKIRLG